MRKVMWEPALKTKELFSMIYVGIDVASDKHDCCIIADTGEVLRDAFTISNSREGFETLVKTIISFSTDRKLTDVRIGLEATGHYSTNLVNFLKLKGFQMTVFNPLHVNLFRKAQSLRKTKTDKTDARFIAAMLFNDDSKSHTPESYHISELKSLVRHRFRLISLRSKLKVSVSRLITVLFPELHTVVWSVHQASSYAMLREYPTAQAVAGCHLTKLTNILSDNSNGHYGKAKAIKIKELALISIGTNSRAMGFELQQTIRLIDNLQVEIDAVDKQIKEAMKELNSPILSIPGISYTLGSIIIAEIGDISNFDNPSKLLAYAGLEPSTYQSGKFNAGNTPMVKRGSTYLRWAFLTAARLVAMRDTTFKDYYNKKISEGKHHYVAVSHVGKKLLRVVFHILKSNSVFVPQT